MRRSSKARAAYALRYYVSAGAAIVVAGLATQFTSAALPPPTADGWFTWRVTAIDDAPNWCCFSWRNKSAQSEQCDLADDHGHYGSDDDPLPAPGDVQMYAEIDGGDVTTLRALSPRCAVRTGAPVTDLGRVDPADSVAWLAQLLAPRTRVSSHALAAIAVHRGDVARSTLLATARTDARLKNRKDAVFWIGQVRSADSAAQLKQLMFEDRNVELREHAAFSLSQSPVPDRAAALVRLGNTDASPKVRAQAWFWLSQTGAAQSESAINAALDKEADRHVRHQAIFALSQLPDERAAHALIALVENRDLPRRDRKQALFWMAQSESPQALRYLDRLLAER